MKNTIYRILGAIVGVGAVLLVTVGSFEIFEFVGADEIMVVQFPTGALKCYSSPGYQLQWFGKVNKYKKRDQFWFSSKTDQGKTGEDESIKVRFNDGGHANVSGSLSWEMPIDEKHILELNSKYGSHTAIEHQLIRTIVEKSVYMTGPLMSSAESYAAKRNDLLNYIEDQIRHGVYKTTSRDKLETDEKGQTKTVKIVELVKDKEGKVLREVESPLDDFGIKIFNLSINEIKYDPTVEQQIQAQQKQIMDIQTSIAKAKTAEQDALTTEQEGKAHAAKLKWEQEAIKAQEVVTAEKNMAVAVLRAQQEYTNAVIQAEQKVMASKKELEAAENKKKTDIALGEGEAKRRQLVMEADGALEKKLTAWTEVQKYYADAFSKYQGSFVPQIMNVSGGGTNSMPTALNLIDLMTVKTARDLALDLQPTGKK